MFYLFLVTYGTIFVSELVGDKNIYTISSLATRFRLVSIFCGFTAAFAIKTLVAIMLGSVIAELPPSLVATASSLTFFLTALFIWFKRSSNASTEPDCKSRLPNATLLPFATILFSEWGDVGQIMTATLAARYHAPLIIFLGATLALVTKGLLALMIGFSFRRRVPISILRPVSASLCLIMGVISAVSPVLTSSQTH